MTYPRCEDCTHVWHGLTCTVQVSKPASWGGTMMEACKCPGPFKEDADE